MLCFNQVCRLDSNCIDIKFLVLTIVLWSHKMLLLGEVRKDIVNSLFCIFGLAVILQLFLSKKDHFSKNHFKMKRKMIRD